MAIRAKLTTLEELQSTPQRAAKAAPPRREHSDEEKAKRKERVARAKDALARSVGAKGDHVAPARAALKRFLQQLNDPKQPDDEKFEELLAAPFTVPVKKKAGERRG